MPLAINDIVQVTVEGRKDGQTLLNVFHYRCTVAPSTGTPAENIQAFLDQDWEVDTGRLEPLWTAVMPDDYNLRLVKGQRVSPTRSAYVEKFLVDNGDIAAFQMDTANLAWVFVKQTELAGRRGRGTTHMLLPGYDWILNGELSAEGATERTNLVGAIDDTIVVVAGGTYEPILYHPGFSPNFSRITHCTIKQEIRTMRRRTVGRGI